MKQCTIILFVIIIQPVFFAQTIETIVEPFIVSSRATSVSSKKSDSIFKVDSDGNKVVAWLDERNGYQDIYYSVVSNNGELIQPETKVNTTSNELKKKFSFAIGPFNEIIFVWEDIKESNKIIYGQKFIEFGISAEPPFVVDSFLYISADLTPRIVISKNGSYLITWINGNIIDARFYSSKGITSKKVEVDNRAIYSHFINNLQIKEHLENHFVLVWLENNVGSDFKDIIVSQFFDSEGKKDGGNNTLLTEDRVSYFHLGYSDADTYNLMVKYYKSEWGHFLYSYSTNSSSLIFNKKLLWDINFWPDAAASSPDSNLILFQNKVRSNIETIVLLLFNKNGEQISGKIELQLDNEGFQITSPSLSETSSGNFIVNYQIIKTTGSEIYDYFHYSYVALFSSDGNLLNKTLVNTDVQIQTHQIQPTIAVVDSGNFIVSWINLINEREKYEVLLSKFDKNGKSEYDTVVDKVEDTFVQLYYPQIYTNDNSLNAIVKWHTDFGYAAHINTRLLDYQNNFLSDISTIGYGGYYCNTEFVFSENETFAYWDTWSEGTHEVNYSIIDSNWIAERQTTIPRFSLIDYIDVVIFNTSTLLDNETLIVCEVPDDPPQTIFIGSYNINEKEITNVFKVESLSSGVGFDALKMLSFMDGSYFVIWSETKSSEITQIVIKKFSKEGILLNQKYLTELHNMKEEISLGKFSPSKFQVLKLKNGNLLLIYQTDIKIVSIAINKELNIISESDIYTFTNKNEKNFSYYVNEGLLYVAWDAEDENSNKRNVWAKVLRLEEAVGIKEEAKLIKTFDLSQNYPNPFNPSTVIKYSIPVETRRGVLPHVTLKIYDVLGKEVATLVNKEQSAGSYEVEFSAKGLSSGVYFYRLQTGGFVETKKMLLLR